MSARCVCYSDSRFLYTRTRVCVCVCVCVVSLEVICVLACDIVLYLFINE